MEAEITIYGDVTSIQELRIFHQLDHPLAITAPLEADERVLIGLYCELSGSACINISVQAFDAIRHILYDPKGFRLLAHGIKRIWERWYIGNHDTWTDGIADTEIMAYLLDSGRKEEEYSLSHLARRYLGFTYPLRAEEICDKRFPEAFYEILTDGAYLIAELAALLLDQMDADLKFLYFYGELPVQLILIEMTRRGIPVDGAACAESYGSMRNQRNSLAEEITGGQEVNLWDGRQVYALLRERNARFPNRGIHRRQEVSHKELKQITHYNPIASRILQWRDLETDLNFLKAAEGQSRIHPRWNVMTRTSRITASHPAVQSVNKVT